MVMGMFGFGKKKGVVDLTKNYRANEERAAEMRADSVVKQTSSESSDIVPFPFFGASQTNESSATDNSDISDSSVPESAEEKRKKLAKRLMDMTSKMEDLNNQIYHLQQRVEVLEKKNAGNRFE